MPFFQWPSASNLHFLSSEALSAVGPSVPLPAAVQGRGPAPVPAPAPAPAPGGRRGGKSPGQLVWSRTPQNQRPPLFYPLRPWQTFALQLSRDASQHLTPTLLSGNANQGPHKPCALGMEKKEGKRGDTGNERAGEWKSKKKRGRCRGSSLRATRQSQSLWQRQTRRRDYDRH